MNKSRMVATLLLPLLLSAASGQDATPFNDFTTSQWIGWRARAGDTNAPAAITEADIRGLATVLAGTNRPAQRQAARSLAVCGPRAEAALPALRKALHDDYLCLRLECLIVLTDLGPVARSAWPDMAALLTDTNVHVRALAAQCLGRLGAGARPYLPPLRALQADPDARCRENAAAAIQAIEKTGRP